MAGAGPKGRAAAPIARRGPECGPGCARGVALAAPAPYEGRTTSRSPPAGHLPGGVAAPA